MRSLKNNERDILKCLHELTRAVAEISYFLEKGEHKDDVIKRINGQVGSLRERLGRLDIRIGRE
jgi:hypothetical protein